MKIILTAFAVLTITVTLAHAWCSTDFQCYLDCFDGGFGYSARYCKSICTSCTN